MKDAQEKPQRHTLYLTDEVWGELKLRAFVERKSASDIVTFLLAHFLKEQPEDIPMSRYQPRLGEESTDVRRTRTVYVPTSVWQQAEQGRANNEKGYSLSGVVEYLLRQYLGLLPVEDQFEQRSGEGEPENAVNTGSYTFDLGSGPHTADHDSRRPHDLNR